MTDIPVQHLSPSSIAMFGRCGRQYMYRYDLGRERNSGTMPQYVADIIAAIYERRTRAIITTNLSSGQVGDRYGSEIRSRLLDSAWITPIRCSGDDLRIRRNDTGGSNDTE